ncbi:MAG: WbqC family protein [Desulfobacterales bacterium]|nr:WbqC family protein [Desulfobacterales bacterium]
MKIAVMQPYFFPYIGYWQLIHAVDHFVIYDDVNYIKGGWINRNRILINEKPSYITVPLHKASSFKRICDTVLQPSPFWRKNLVKTVEMNYRKAPYFEEVFPIVADLIRFEVENLSDYLVYQLKTLSKFMGINTHFRETSRYYGNSALHGQARILDICKREAATVYINLQGGQALYERNAFTQFGVELKFIKPATLEYKQFGSGHVPWLSIIDVLMFNPTRRFQTLLNSYNLL